MILQYIHELREFSNALRPRITIPFYEDNTLGTLKIFSVLGSLLQRKRGKVWHFIKSADEPIN
jgi:hypothetical protein